MSDYRFMLNSDGTITRGRAYRLPSEWTSDAWSHYWDQEGMIAFTVDWHYGSQHVVPVAGTDEDGGNRATVAFSTEQDNLPGSEGALDRVAQRYTQNPDACFIHVGLDRGTDLYALSYHGDPEGELRNEIEAVNNGDIWRIECEEYRPGFGFDGGDWVPSDEYPEEFYGEDKATAEFERIFTLAEFPAEQFVTADD